MSDIKLINGKYYDFGCKNESFLETAKELKTLGIKNYYFMLRIDNPRVADIDPFNPNITKQEIQALMMEFRSNIWFFMRTAVRLRTQKGTVPYGLHRGLAAVTWCFERHQDSCICEPRQTYKTSGTLAGPIQWAFQLSTDLKMHFYGKSSENTKDNLATLKDDIALLPEWLQFKRYMGEDGKVKKSRQSTEILENNLLKNSLKIHASAKTLAAAQNLGRGSSGNVLYFDEIEHTLFFPEILSNSAPLFKTAAENAAASGRPYCRLMSCTPGNLDTREGRESYPVIKSMIPFSENLYDMTDEEIQAYKDSFKEEYHNSEEKHQREVIDVMYIEFQYYQLRRDYNWVLDQYKLSGDKMAIRREILLQRLRGSTESPIDPEDIEYLISNMKKPYKDILVNKVWLFKLYHHGQGMIMGRPKELDENIPYLVGIDPAGGGAGDNFAITIVNPYNLQIAAEFKSPYISGPNAVRMLVSLVHDYIPKAVLIPEKNSMGIYLLQMLLETDVRDNIYWSESLRQLEEISEENPDDHEMKSMAQQYKKYSTYLTQKVRKAMFELLFQHINECKQILCTENLVNDICKLVRTSTGKIEAVKGEHDDSLMSYLHAIYIYYTGDNLETFGIFKQDNPIWGKINSSDVDIEDNTEIVNSSITNAINTETPLGWEETVMKDAQRLEGEIKDLCTAFSFIHDEVYSRDDLGVNNNMQSESVNIGGWFFDQLNGV